MGLSKTDPLLGCVENSVEAFHPEVPVDEIEPFAARASKLPRHVSALIDCVIEHTYVRNHKVYAIIVATEGSVQRAGPDLSVGGERNRGRAYIEVQVLEVSVLLVADLEKASCAVLRCPCGLLIGVESVYTQSLTESIRSKLSDGPVASMIIVVPLSTIPAVLPRIVEPPYVTDWSIPQYSLDGYVCVIGT